MFHNRESRKLFTMHKRTVVRREKSTERKIERKNENEVERKRKQRNPDELKSQQDSNTYFITQTDSSEKSLNMQIALNLFQ